MKHIKEVILPDAAFILHSHIYIRVFIFYSPASGSCHCHIDYLCIKTVVSYLIHYIIMHLAFYICRTQTVYSVKFFIGSFLKSCHCIRNIRIRFHLLRFRLCPGNFRFLCFKLRLDLFPYQLQIHILIFHKLPFQIFALLQCFKLL